MYCLLLTRMTVILDPILAHFELFWTAQILYGRTCDMAFQFNSSVFFWLGVYDYHRPRVETVFVDYCGEEERTRWRT